MTEQYANIRFFLAGEDAIILPDSRLSVFSLSGKLRHTCGFHDHFYLIPIICHRLSLVLQ